MPHASSAFEIRRALIDEHDGIRQRMLQVIVVVFWACGERERERRRPSRMCTVSMVERSVE
jgi:hypothetical protein